jgi:tetratricopeptide (TPR) repeat protein
MRRCVPPLLTLMLVIGLPVAGATDPRAPQSPVQSSTTAQQRLDAAADAANAEKFEEANELVQELLAMPEFLQLPEFEQYRGMLVAALCALERQDALEAHDYLIAVTSFEFAEADSWKHRAFTAQQIEDWGDSLVSLTKVARRWPGELAGDAYDDLALSNIIQMSARDPGLRAQRLEFMNALFDGGYTQEFGTQPDGVWLELTTDAVQRGDMLRARAIAKRIAGSSALVQLNSDRRFDALVAAEPSLRDVRGAASRERQRLAELLAAQPRSLSVLLRYTYALYTLGEFDEMLKLATDAIAKVDNARPGKPAYDDVDLYLTWLYNQKAFALRGMGRDVESTQVLAQWQRDPRNSQDKASQSINLGSMLNRAGKPREALEAIDGIDWARGLSPYGRMQLQAVRHQAYLQLGQSDDAETVLAWIREHRQESPSTARHAFVLAGDLDTAAALLIGGLNDPDTRAATLATLQQYEHPRRVEKRSEFARRAADNHRRLLERPDVRTAIEKYGRAGSYPVYNMQ